MENTESANLKRIKQLERHHAYLWIYHQCSELALLVDRFVQSFLCCDEGQPDCSCQGCMLYREESHPDAQILRPVDEKDIAIDRIRELSEWVYQTPQLAQKKVVVIYSAERMTANAANALLKILEEPPMTVRYLLLTQHPESLLATIASRCLPLRLQDSEPFSKSEFATFPAFAQKALMLHPECHDVVLEKLDLWKGLFQEVSDWPDQSLDWVDLSTLGGRRDLAALFLDGLYYTIASKQETLSQEGFSVLQKVIRLKQLHRQNASINWPLAFESLLLT